MQYTLSSLWIPYHLISYHAYVGIWFPGNLATSLRLIPRPSLKLRVKFGTVLWAPNHRLLMWNSLLPKLCQNISLRKDIFHRFPFFLLSILPAWSMLASYLMVGCKIIANLPIFGNVKMSTYQWMHPNQHRRHPQKR